VEVQYAYSHVETRVAKFSLCPRIILGISYSPTTSWPPALATASDRPFARCLRKDSGRGDSPPCCSTSLQV